jgi:GntR family transcriptional repressor for pyruvate dehydrogenase complex
MSSPGDPQPPIATTPARSLTLRTMTKSAEHREPVQRRRLSDEVAKQLEDEIVSGLRPVGDRLPAEKDLAQSFGVGRSSMREAIRTLEAAGYLRSSHGVGVFVVTDQPLSAPALDQALHGGYTMSDLFEARVSIESKTAELAARRLTDEFRSEIYGILDEASADGITQEKFVSLDARFHRAIASASGNPLLLHMWDLLAPQFHEYSTRVIGMPGRLAHAHADHKALATAIADGDSELASRLAQDHINAVERELHRSTADG